MQEILDRHPPERQQNRSRQPLATRSRAWFTGASGAMAAALILVLFLAACSRGASEVTPTAAWGQTESPEATLPVGVPTHPPADPVPTATATAVTPPAPLAAMVNGEYLFLTHYEAVVADYEQGLLEGGLDPSSEAGQAELADMRRNVLEDMIDFVLIAQGGATLGVGLSAEEVEAQVQVDIVEGGGQESFDEWLAATGQTREDYVTMVGDALLAQRVLDAVTDDVPDLAEQVHAWRICVGTSAEVEQLLALLEQGSTFENLALEWSLDTAGEEGNGDLGWFPRGVIAPELEQEAFSLQIGQVSDVVQLDGGYCLLQVAESEAERAVAPELLLQLKLVAFDRWLDELRAASDIDRFVTE